MKPSLTRSKKFGAVAAALVTSTVLLAGCDNPPATVRIGVAQPLSGNLAALGQDLHNGVKLAGA